MVRLDILLGQTIEAGLEIGLGLQIYLGWPGDLVGFGDLVGLSGIDCKFGCLDIWFCWSFSWVGALDILLGLTFG